ncbi:MAG: hypothetical protein ALECFALPRED_004863 [Alectoria fallacina]|uniref:DUF7726 domain-containing protein n=1 Tax=Alectoria fallacina TaxID=1903189 RepID=A0A8H3EEM7_9LECA|nr:MAG: hypothetical protein ALECFALPRED_004863 [Alectoria fallacina]
MAALSHAVLSSVSDSINPDSRSSDGSIPSGRFLSLPLAAVFTESAPSKRPFSAIESLSDSDNGYDSDDAPVKENCDAIRRKINSFINSGELKVTDFQRACDINCSSYGRFMKLKGPYAGDMNQAYKAAFQFFELKKDEEIRKLDVSGIELGGEDDESVPIYDTCDEIRRKIAAYLREPNVTQTGFLRELAKMLTDPSAKLQSKQLKDFQTKKGALEGQTSRIYYAAYLFFEKQRLLQGKSKSKKRENNEKVWALEGGIDTKRRHGNVWCLAGEKPYVDKYGKTHIAGRL